MNTLYVSDLDGTLLRSSAVISAYTNNVINNLTEKGMIFSYATARSIITAKQVTRGLRANIPLITYNGAFIIDNNTEEILAANYFDKRIKDVLDDLFEHQIFPVVYACIEKHEKFSYVPERCTRGMISFLESRKGDIRTNAVATPEALKKGNIFYITCIDDPCKLEPLYEKYKNTFHCIYQRDIYTKEQWLEIMPKEATKSHAVLQLKKLLECDKLVVFGDGKNDLDMFEIADECYAVRNADAELKERATAIIGSNDEDGVAKWLAQNYL